MSEESEQKPEIVVIERPVESIPQKLVVDEKRFIIKPPEDPNLKKISYKDFSMIIQGAIFKCSNNNLNKEIIKNYLPNDTHAPTHEEKRMLCVLESFIDFLTANNCLSKDIKINYKDVS